MEIKRTYTSIESMDDYNIYYNSFEPYDIVQLVTLCEKNNINTGGSREILLDKLAFYYSNLDKPSRFIICMKSIKKIFYIA